nr:hypothetical protein [uncultured Halomonas sp.]
MSESDEEKFFSAKLKVERARSHIRELSNNIVDYLKSKPFKVVITQHPGSKEQLWMLRVRHDIPRVYAAIIGDVIHNLRASLDLLATELVTKSGGDPNKIYFPFGNDETSLDNMIKRRGIDQAGKEIVGLIKSLKPYKGGNELLRGLHDLDITDKHKSLIPVAHYVGLKNIKTTNASGGVTIIQNMHCGPITDGMVLAILPPVNNFAVGQSFTPSLKLTLNEEILKTDEDIIQLLNRLVTMVEGIICQFEKHLEEPGKAK